MAVTDDRTPNRNYPVPHGGNHLSDDQPRLAAAFSALDADMQAALTDLATKAAAGHQHAIAEITGLQAELDGKAAAGHVHGLDSLSDVSVSGAANGQFLSLVANTWQGVTLTANDFGGYTQSQIDAALALKAEAAHGHAIGDVGGLQAVLDGKAANGHGHAISEITDLQAALNGKAASRSLASQAEAEAGTSTTIRDWTPLRIREAVESLSPGLPVGTVIEMPSATPPAGYLPYQGGTYSRATYADLWAFAQASGNLAASEGAKQKGQFGPGDGSTTFSLPDGRGVFSRQVDAGAGIDPGRALGTLQNATEVYNDGGVGSLLHVEGQNMVWESDGGVTRSLYSMWTGRTGAATQTIRWAKVRPVNVATNYFIKF